MDEIKTVNDEISETMAFKLGYIAGIKFILLWLIATLVIGVLSAAFTNWTFPTNKVEKICFSLFRENQSGDNSENGNDNPSENIGENRF